MGYLSTDQLLELRKVNWNMNEVMVKIPISSLSLEGAVEQYATIEYKDFKNIMDCRRYEVILADQAFMRRVHSRVVWAFDRKYNN